MINNIGWKINPNPQSIKKENEHREVIELVFSSPQKQ